MKEKSLTSAGYTITTRENQHESEKKADQFSGPTVGASGASATFLSASVTSGRQMPQSEHPLHFGLSSRGGGEWDGARQGRGGG